MTADAVVDCSSFSDGDLTVTARAYGLRAYAGWRSLTQSKGVWIASDWRTLRRLGQAERFTRGGQTAQTAQTGALRGIVPDTHKRRDATAPDTHKRLAFMALCVNGGRSRANVWVEWAMFLKRRELRCLAQGNEATREGTPAKTACAQAMWAHNLCASRPLPGRGVVEMVEMVETVSSDGEGRFPVPPDANHRAATWHPVGGIL